MSIKFSLLLPTRHRPDFVAHALRYMANQTYSDFEIIVSDNYVDPAQSCRKEFDLAGLGNARYVRPPTPLGMVDNWNYALEYAKGDYILCFTDKMFLLPNTLAGLAQTIEKAAPEIVSWVDDKYTPIDFKDYFGAGYYYISKPGVAKGQLYAEFDPMEELSIKGRAEILRPEQSSSQYVRGKICFGAFCSDLVSRIHIKYGKLFQPLSPDYTSMILGLSEARSAVEYGHSGIVHLNTDLSNGMLCATNDAFALTFLQQSGNLESTLSDLLVPGLYTSSHNAVARDYSVLKNRYGLPFDFDAINWLVCCAEDIEMEGRIWSTPNIEAEQKRILLQAVGRLNDEKKKEYDRKLEKRRTGKANRYDLISRSKRLLHSPYLAWLYSALVHMRKNPMLYSNLESAVVASSMRAR